MLAVVQKISSGWWKEFRGGPQAGIRNQVPEAEFLEFPVEWPQSNPVVVQRLSYSFSQTRRNERKESRLACATSASLDEPLNLGCVRIRADGGQLLVDFHWTSADGMPERHTRKDILKISPGQWGRVRYNARMSRMYYSQPEWYYAKHVLNIGLFDIVDPRVFLDTQPLKTHSDMAQLW